MTDRREGKARKSFRFVSMNRCAHHQLLSGIRSLAAIEVKHDDN